MAEEFDFIVIGGGIAGVSTAAVLAATHRVALVEQESQAGYHSTGRSAAILVPLYGETVVRKLTEASRSLLESPPPGFSEAPLLKRRDVLLVASDEQRPMIESFLADPQIKAHGRRLSTAEILARVPILRPEWAVNGFLDQSTADIDVNALQEGFLRRARSEGATILFDCGVDAIARTNGGWQIETKQGLLSTAIIVNAAGAWADEIAIMAGVRPLGLLPCRRTAILVPAPEGHDINSWPVVGDVGETFYFKPDAGAIMISPSDEEPVAPCDTQAEEFDVAMAVHKFETATTVKVAKVAHRWAGLRSFFPDRMPAIGYDEGDRAFFWVAGQGGFGIQTAPAISRLAASLACGGDVPADLAALDFSSESVTPGRLKGEAIAPLSSNLVRGMNKHSAPELF